MRNKTTLILCGLFAMTFAANAQESEREQIEKLEKRLEALESNAAKQKALKISGYVQTQFQHGEEDASLKVGSGNEDKESSFNRFGIRRGRVKFTYDKGLASGVFQLDVTEKGVKFKDAYLNVKDPWVGTCGLRAGIFDRPFGNEISYSSSLRESPERSAIFQTLFPDERDLGAMIILQGKKNTWLNAFKLQAGLFAGNGIKLDTDSKKDFIGHLTYSKTFGSSAQLGLGTSFYRGYVYQGSDNVYSVSNGEFVCNSSEGNNGDYAKRQYIGFDAQLSFSTILGLTNIRGEYLFGDQPGTSSSSKSPNYDALPTSDTYLREMSGWYVILVQDLGNSPFAAVLKYDTYDPNTEVSGNGVDAAKGFSKADLKQETFGFGALWRINSALRLQAYYEINKNEKSANISGYESDRKDNVFTLRLQYKF